MIITTAEQLQAVADDMTADYELGGDIDLSGIDWVPLGASATQDSTSITSFTGTFNGNGHTIKNLKINRNTTDTYNFVGLFARIGGTVQNLVIKDANIVVEGYNPCVGILAGYSYYESTAVSIQNVSVSGNITLNHKYAYKEYSFRGVGGLIGSTYNSTRSVITDCISKVTINVSGDSQRACHVSGFIGYGNGATLTRCYAFGSITVTNTEDTALKISGMQSLCYNTTHNNCACAVNIIGADSATVIECCKYLTSTISFTNTSSRRYWENSSVSWESYSSDSDTAITQDGFSDLIGADNLDKYNLSGLNFANGKYLKLAIETDETPEVSYDITISGITYNGTEHKDLILTKSDFGQKIRQVETGRVFDEAVDPKDNQKEYIEIENE